MTLLGRPEIEQALSEHDPTQRLVVSPLLDRRQIGRGAVDLRLGTEFLVLRQTRLSVLDPAELSDALLGEMYERVVVPFGEQFWLHPHHFVLAATLEFVAMPSKMAAYVVGRSSWGRLGLIVATAVFVHPAYRGCLTLELVNDGNGPIRLSPGMRIAQLVIHALDVPAPLTETEEEKYVAPVRPQPSLLSRERDEFQRLMELGQDLRSRLG